MYKLQLLYRITLQLREMTLNTTHAEHELVVLGCVGVLASLSHVLALMHSYGENIKLVFL